MSVVNKMLQDLEQRQGQENELNAEYQPTANNKRNWAMLALVLLVLAIAVSWYFNVWQRLTQAQPQQQMPRSTPVPETQAKPMQIQQRATVEQVDDAQELAITTYESAKAEPEQQALAPLPVEPEPSLSTSEQNSAVVQEPSDVMSIQVKPSQGHSDARAKAQQAIAQGDTTAAIVALQALISQEPDNIAARKKLASLLFSDNQTSKAAQLLSGWLEQWPHRADLRLMQARLFLSQEQPQKALNTLLNQQPDIALYSDYFVQRASLSQQLEQHKQAFADYLALATHAPQEARWWLGLAVSAEGMGDLASAKAAYQKALALDQLATAVNDFMQQRLADLEVSS